MSNACRAERRSRDEAAVDGLCDAAPPRQLPRSEPSSSASLAAPPCVSSCNPFTGRPYSASYDALLQARQKLPIFAYRTQIQDTVRAHPVTLLVGETGSGKTTQVPHFLAELRADFAHMICCTQPRRIAAISVAARVASEMDVALGEEVGYHVRFQSRFSADKTRVLYLTDGMLLRDAFGDPDLGKYSVVVVDEAHERSVDTDVVLGVLKLLVQRRPTLRVVVMSATLDVDKLRRFFPAAPLLRVSGRMYDVQVFYMPRAVKDYVEAAIECVAQLHERESAGDILCFLTGEAEIERAVAATTARLTGATCRESDRTTATATAGADGGDARPTHAVVLPLYGALSLAEQQKVFQPSPPDARKIVFATNIAETSVTIDGIVYVVDCGYQKQKLHSAGARVDYLLPAVISKASAEQRKGRAGRTRPGKCYRLVTAAEYASGFPDQTAPELLRSSMLNTVLLLLKLGVGNPCEFPFIDAPSDESLEDAFFQLLYFGAVDEELRLTELGRRMAELPVDACVARMLLSAAKHGCSADAVVVAAMLEAAGTGGSVFTRPSARAAAASAARAAFERREAGDHATLFHVFHGYYRNQQNGAQYCWEHFLRHQSMQQAVQVYQQLRRLLATLQVPICSTYNAERDEVDTVALRKALLEGFFMQVAYLDPRGNVYRTVRDGTLVHLHRQSCLSNNTSSSSSARSHARLPTWVMYDRLEVQSASEGTFMRVASPVEVDWLLDVSAYYTTPGEIADGAIALALRTAAERRHDATTSAAVPHGSLSCPAL